MIVAQIGLFRLNEIHSDVLGFTKSGITRIDDFLGQNIIIHQGVSAGSMSPKNHCWEMSVFKNDFEVL